jgi:outer membrane immunogenic protein
MIRKLLMASVATATIAGSALAADLPSRKAPPPAYIPPPILSWQGFYVGVNGGGMWSNSRTISTVGTDLGVATPGAGPFSAAAALSATNIFGNTGNNNNRVGFLAGGQWGYNWQWNQIVLGTESDFQGTFDSCRNNNNNGGFLFGGGNNNGCVVTGVGIAPIDATGLNMITQQSVERRMDYFGTSRVRAGFLVTPTLLLYGTGGVAYGHIRTTSLISTNVAGVPAGVVVPGVSLYNDTRIKAGYTAGGGIEWMFLPNWSVKVEALYYDLGRTTFNQNFVQTLGPASGAPGLALSNTSTRTTFRNDGVIARAGLNYHFSWGAPAPVVARY